MLDLYSHVLPGMQEGAVAKVDAPLRAGQDSRKASYRALLQRGLRAPVRVSKRTSES